MRILVDNFIRERVVDIECQCVHRCYHVDKIELGWSEIETSQVGSVEVAIFWPGFKMIAIWL